MIVLSTLQDKQKDKGLAVFDMIINQYFKGEIVFPVGVYRKMKLFMSCKRY